MQKYSNIQFKPRLFKNTDYHSYKLSGKQWDHICAVDILTRKVSRLKFQKDYSNLPFWLNELGMAVLANYRFERWHWALSSVGDAITRFQRAVDLTPESHPDFPVWLSNLGTAFQALFNAARNFSDLETAIIHMQKAVNLISGDCSPYPMCFNNLGRAFQARFDRSGSLSDLETAIIHMQHAVNLTLEDHSDFPKRLNDLGMAFQARFDRTGSLADLETAFIHQQQVVDIAPKHHSDLPIWLNNLGTVFQARFEKSGSLVDVETAVTHQQRAFDLTPKSHPDLPMRLNHLSMALKARFQKTRNLIDLKTAITHQYRAIDPVMKSKSNYAISLSNLGNTLIMHFNHTQDLGICDQAISIFRESIQYTAAHPVTRLQSARNMALLCRKHRLFQSEFFNSFQVAIDLLSEVVGLEQTVQTRHANILLCSQLTTEAAAFAIADKHLELAVSWLEQGRCLVWQQIAQFRTPPDLIRLHDPSLADHFMEVAQALEELSSHPEEPQDISSQKRSQRRTDLAQEWPLILKNVRSLPGLEDFLRPPQFFRLFDSLPRDTPVVIFNIYQDRCDAIVLSTVSLYPLHIPLPDFSAQIATQMCSTFHKYLQEQAVRSRELTSGSNRAVRRPLRPPQKLVISTALQELWVRVVKPIIDVLSLRVLPYIEGQSSHPTLQLPDPPQNRPRLWWCPTGPLSLLPIHAAGDYREGKSEPGSCVSEFVISSYIHTIGALVDKLKDERQANPNLLLISQPATPSQYEIPAARIESKILREIAASRGIATTLLEDETGTVAQVKEDLDMHGWVHFACHGVQDVEEPLKSSFLLHDGSLELLDFMRRRIKNPDHAFLSACQTSAGDPKLADEAVHLAAGMLAAGYRGVVATMWSIRDDCGPEVAEAFYEYLFNHSLTDDLKMRLNSSLSAHALDASIQKLRSRIGDSESSLLVWVPYVHFGI